MSTASTISNLKSALDCSSKCDCCAKLQSQINAINAKLLTEARVRSIAQTTVDSAKNGIIASTKSALEPGIASAVVGGIAVVIDRLKPDVDLVKGLAKQGYDASKAAERASNDALAKSLADARARLAAEEALRAELQGIRGVANSAKAESASAVGKAASAANEALEANNAVGGLKGIVNGIGAKVDGFGRAIGRLESAVGNAVSSAAKAVGISEAALGATGRLFVKVGEIFNIIGTFAVLFEQLATLNVLGGRIDAVESELQFFGNSVSGILGKLLGLQNRIGRNEASVIDVKAIAITARGIGEAANLRAVAAYVLGGQAQTTATTATTKATQAQLTADGAVRNAKIANDNATTAYKKATEAEGIGKRALNTAGDAFNKGVTAIGIATTALALVQLLKLRPGIPGLPGRQGDRGIQGLQGIPGRNGTNGINGLNGITTVVQIPGTPGRDGAPGRQGVPGVRGQRGSQGVPGIAGRNGIDVNPAETASLRALIIQQHTQTRATTTSGIAGVRAFLSTQFAATTALITAFANSAIVGTALNVLTFAATVHNGFMLSNNLAQTLGTVIDQITGIILPKGLDGTPISISTLLGKATHEIIASAIGEANYNTISQDWAKANRIYQSGANVFNQLSNMTGLLTAGLEVIGGNVGKIGNALKKWGVVGEAAFAYMNPQPNLKGKFFNFLNSANDELNTIVTMVAIPIGIGAAAVGVNDSVSELVKSLDQQDPKDSHGNPIPDTVHGGFAKYQPGLAQPIPTVTATAAAQEKADSQNIIQATFDDIFNAND